MVSLTGVFSQLGPCKVMVAGDFMLDTYTIGKARRISPEAPVAVVQVQREEHRPGGAGNVILNLISMGAEVVSFGRVGKDPAGSFLIQALQDEGCDTRGIFVDHKCTTPVKNRILAENQQIVRVDHETNAEISPDFEEKIIADLPDLLQGVQVLAISDYGKGFLSQRILRSLIDHGRRLKIPIIADPKGIEFSKYSGVSIIKPNLGEAYAAANVPLNTSLDEVAEKILEKAMAEALMVTRSEAGISLFEQGGKRHDFPVRVREVRDVTGAGDTVLAMLTCAMANGLPLPAAVQLSNVAAGIAIERFGCARIALSDLARRLLEDDVTNKVFDEEHLFALIEVLRGIKFSVLSISGEKGLTSAIFQEIQALSKNGNSVLVHVTDSVPDPDFVKLLSSLNDVDFIILCHSNLSKLCQSLAPEEVKVL